MTENNLFVINRESDPSANQVSLLSNLHLSHHFSAAAAKSLQSCPTLCDPIDGSPPGSPVPGIFQARTLEWVAISFSNAWKWKVKVKSLSRVRLLENPWTAAYQAPLSMGFARQEYWSGVPLPSLISLLIIAIMGNVPKEAKKTEKNLKNNKRMRTRFYPCVQWVLCRYGLSMLIEIINSLLKIHN